MALNRCTDCQFCGRLKDDIGKYHRFCMRNSSENFIEEVDSSVWCDEYEEEYDED